MRVVVLGAGAIGGSVAAAMARAGVEVALVDPWSRHVEAIVRDGLRVSTVDEEFTVRLRAVTIDRLPEVAPAGLLLLALKSYDTEWAVRYAAEYLEPNARVVSLQNGINEPRIAAIVGAERTVGCVVHLAGELSGPGHVTTTNRRGWKAFTLGDLGGANDGRHAAIADLLSVVGPTAVSADIMSQLWAKLTLNVMSNALAGLTGFATNRLWSDPACVSVMTELGGELVEVAEALGQQVLPIRPAGSEREIPAAQLRAARAGDREAAELVTDVLAAIAARRVGSSENRPSLLQDVLRRRRTEVDHLNGYIVAEGRRVGVPTPVNAIIVDAVHDLEYRGADPSADNLSRVLEAIR